jgi:hypothetical protein
METNGGRDSMGSERREGGSHGQKAQVSLKPFGMDKVSRVTSWQSRSANKKHINAFQAGERVNKVMEIMPKIRGLNESL